MQNNAIDTQVEFDLHGLIGIRLVNPRPKDTRAVAAQLGLKPSTLNRPADITIRFVDQLDYTSPVRLLNIDEMGFTEDAFLVMRAKHKTPARVVIPFDQVGSEIEIRCEHGLTAVPLLVATINVTALAKGALPLHASAFEYNGKGVLATGWSKGGKTETLLAFMLHGARYIGDEWVYLMPDQQMFGIPEPIRLWDWHLQQLPTFYARLSPDEQNRLRALKLAQKVAGAAPLLKRARRLIKNQQHVDVPPEQLFGENGDAYPGRMDKVLFVTSHETPDIVVSPVDAQEIADRMLFSLQYEQIPFYSYYLAYQFAFPCRPNSWVEASTRIQRQRLNQFLAGQESYAVGHPYPVGIDALYEAICPFVE